MFILSLFIFFSQESYFSAPRIEPTSIHSFYTKKKQIPFVPSPRSHTFFSAENYKKTNEKRELANIKKMLQEIMLQLPHNHHKTLKSVKINNHTHPSRGLANSKKVILNMGNIENRSELISVFVHELAHVADLGAFVSRTREVSNFGNDKFQVFKDDPSLDFYKISWNRVNKKKPQAQRKDFISGYAMTSPFEDFAESYLFYRLHGEKFRSIAKKSSMLEAKYHFMRSEIFGGKEYQLGKKDQNFIHNVIWDATLLKI